MVALREQTLQRAARKTSSTRRNVKPMRPRRGPVMLLQRQLGNHRFQQLTTTDRPRIQRQAGGGATPREHRFTAEGVDVVVRRSCGRDDFGFDVVEQGTREALRRIFHTECIEESRREAIQGNLQAHGLDIRCSRSRAFCAETTGFHIPANIFTLGIRAFADDPAAEGCEGGVPATVLHEIVHLTRGFEGEQLPDSCENSCFGTSRGDPELCRDIDVHGRRT